MAVPVAVESGRTNGVFRGYRNLPTGDEQENRPDREQMWVVGFGEQISGRESAGDISDVRCEAVERAIGVMAAATVADVDVYSAGGTRHRRIPLLHGGNHQADTRQARCVSGTFVRILFKGNACFGLRPIENVFTLIFVRIFILCSIL